MLLPATALVADDWPHWRGPQRTGISAESTWPKTWPDDGPAVAWKAKVGQGFSSSVVSKGRVVTLGFADDQDTITCLDAATGKPAWQHSYPAELGDKYFEGGTTGTPTIEGDQVFVFSRLGDALCLSLDTGKVAWSRNILTDTGVRPPDWGFTGAPLVVGDRVYLNAGGGGVALNRASGAVLWKSDPKEAGYSSPLPVGSAGTAAALAVFSSGDAYSAVRLADGTRTWTIRWLTQYGVNAADPILHDQHVFLSSGYGKGCALFALKDSGPEEVWKSKALATQMNPAVLYQDHLYGTAGDTTEKASLKCVVWKTGEVKWTFPGFGSGGLILAGDRILAVTGSGELLQAPASPTGFEPTARAQVVGGKTWTAPVLANGFAYVRNSRGDLVCLDLRPKS